MATFEEQVRAFGEKVRRRAVEVVTQAGVEVQRSVTEGSPVTGAPGQPVDTGELKTSFIPERIAPLIWQTTTNKVYAPAVEEGIQQPYTTVNGTLVTPRPMQFKSAVGGAHSVALTRAAWPRVVDVATGRVVRASP